jgi:hypothetical protein
MSEQEKSLGQEAHDAFHLEINRHIGLNVRAVWPADNRPEQDGWEAGAQAVAARVRAETAQEIEALRQQIENQNMGSEVCGMVRAAAKELFQGNCAFVDDDICLVAAVANWALLNGIPDEMNPEILPKSKAAAVARCAALSAPTQQKAEE